MGFSYSCLNTCIHEQRQCEVLVMNKPDGIELALLHALRYEEASLKYADAGKRWNLTSAEKETVLKWMANRMTEIKDKM